MLFGKQGPTVVLCSQMFAGMVVSSTHAGDLLVWSDHDRSIERVIHVADNVPLFSLWASKP